MGLSGLYREAKSYMSELFKKYFGRYASNVLFLSKMWLMDYSAYKLSGVNCINYKTNLTE